MKLFFREYGEGPPVIILHGLFGSSDNWLTQAKMLANHYKVIVPDQRNHGKSPHHEKHTYTLLAEDLNEFMEEHQINNPVILGHSMGGKAAIKFALTYPDKLKALIVVDIAPKNYPVHHDNILEGLKSIEVDSIQSRSEADEQLAKYVPGLDVRQFLLKSLQRKSEGGFRWKLNLSALDKNIEAIGSGAPYTGTFDKETLFIRGSASHYIKDEDRTLIKKLFPNSTLVTLEAGHWVHAERSEEFVETVLKFMEEKVSA
jgi:pimeloyl-ACP methyl ester carboxylesterase